MKYVTAQKNEVFPLRISPVNVTKSVVTFTKEILNGTLNFLCSVYKTQRWILDARLPLNTHVHFWAQRTMRT